MRLLIYGIIGACVGLVAASHFDIVTPTCKPKHNLLNDWLFNCEQAAASKEETQVTLYVDLGNSARTPYSTFDDYPGYVGQPLIACQTVARKLQLADTASGANRRYWCEPGHFHATNATP